MPFFAVKQLFSICSYLAFKIIYNLFLEFDILSITWAWHIPFLKLKYFCRGWKIVKCFQKFCSSVKRKIQFCSWTISFNMCNRRRNIPVRNKWRKMLNWVENQRRLFKRYQIWGYNHNFNSLCDNSCCDIVLLLLQNHTRVIKTKSTCWAKHETDNGFRIDLYGVVFSTLVCVYSFRLLLLWNQNDLFIRGL